MADINWGYGGGVSAGEIDNVFARRRDRMEKRAAAPDIAPALGGDKEALGRVAQASPDIALKLATTIATMDFKRQGLAKAHLELSGRLAAGILGAPPEQQAALYESGLQEAKAYGLDTSTWPQTWSPAAKAWLEHNGRMIGSAAQIYKRISGGGGGAVGPGGGAFGGPPLAGGARVSDAGPVVGGAPMVADAGGVPPAAPMPTLAGAPQTAPARPPMMAQAALPPAAGPMPGDIPPTPAIAPAGAVLPAAAPVARPQAAPTQMAAAGIQDDAGESGPYEIPAPRPAGGYSADRANEFGLAAGEMYGVEPKSGKIIVEGNRILVRTRDRGDVMRLMPTNSVTPLGTPKPADARADPDAAWSVHAQLPPGWSMGKSIDGLPAIDKNGRYLIIEIGADGKPTGKFDALAPNKPAADRAPPTGYQPNPQGGGVMPIPGGPADPIQAKALADAKAKADAKAIPPGREKAMTDNLGAVQQIDRAIGLLEARPDSVGGFGSNLANNLPGVGNLQNRIDKDGTELRSIIANIGSLVIHERSGAAVTASEFPRLRPFIPSIGDDPVTVRKKLEQFKAAYLDEMQSLNEVYSPGGGYRAHGPTQRYLDKSGGAPQTGPGAPPASKPAPGGGAAAPPAQTNAPEIPKGRADDLRRKYELD